MQDVFFPEFRYESLSLKMEAVLRRIWSPNGGLLFQVLLAESAEPRGENRASVYISGEAQQVSRLYFVKKALERMFYALVPHTNAHAILCRPTPKDDERFRNGSVHEFHIV